MRVNTGIARGKNIETLAGSDVVRPTSQKAKEAIFSAIQFFIPGASMLDLYAGSGQMGIEALSRGATHCVFVDQSRDAINIIKKNLKNTGLFAMASVAQGDAISYMERTNHLFDFIYADPPYHKDLAGEVLLRAGRLLNENGLLAIETEKEVLLPKTMSRLSLRKQYTYGNTSIWLYEIRQQEEETE